MPPGPVRVLMVSSEVESLARTGGLGDAVEALSRALASLGADVVVATPRYGVTRVPASVRSWPVPVVAPLGLGHARTLGVLEARLTGSAPATPAREAAARRAPRATLLCDEQLFDRDGIYGDRRGTFTDNPFRFATLSSGALSVAERAWDGALPDVVHAHDWHAALSILYARRTRGLAWSRVPSVLTIHNLAFQGVVPPPELDYLAIPRDAWEAGWIRHDGAINLMKGAIELADRVTTVSETYAREIQHPPSGFGLDAHLRWHSGKLVGVVNGIDTESFDPSTDGAIARRYGQADAIEGKRACKQALCAELGLGGDGPLFGVVSRLQWLKGIDLLLAILPALVERGARVAFVGTGERDLEDALRGAAWRWPGRVATRIAFDPMLARRVFAGADFLAVPSRDEPCGLTQLYAMRYGAIPVVTPVGGLRDTVEPFDVAHAKGTGIVAAAPDPGSLLLACEDALGLWRDPIGMASLIARAMARDSSWGPSAAKYLAIYEGLRPAGADRAQGATDATEPSETP
jgi:starch synthase